MNFVLLRLLPLLTFSLLTACSLVPPYQRPAMDIPQHWKQSGPHPIPKNQTAQANDITFHNAQLADLMARALVKNHDLRAALQRIQQARAVSSINQANKWFTVDAGSDISVTASKPKTINDSAYRVNLDVAYEVDLWGRNRALRDAAKQRLQASLWDHHALKLIITSDLATAYIGLLATRERIRVAQHNLQNAQQILAIVRARFREGANSALELRQQETSVANGRATIATLKQSEEGFFHQLAVLTGISPAQLQLTIAQFTTLKYQQMQTVLPTHIFAQRPDLRSAEAILVAANIDIGVARAALFPNLNLGIDAVVSASPISVSALRSITGAATTAMPLFHGGALRGEWRRTQARKEELAEQYLQSVLVAFREVEDALAFRRAAVQRLHDRIDAARAAEQAYSLSRERFDAGAIDFQTLLDTQRDRFLAEDALIQARQDVFLAEVNLYKAVGG